MQSNDEQPDFRRIRGIDAEGVERVMQNMIRIGEYQGDIDKEKLAVRAATVLERGIAINQKDEHHDSSRKLAQALAHMRHGSDEVPHVTNQQINIYVPDNSRGPEIPQALPQIGSNGNGNGKHQND